MERVCILLLVQILRVMGMMRMVIMRMFVMMMRMMMMMMRWKVEGARKLPPTCTHGAVVVGRGWVCNQVGLPKPVG